MKRILFIANPMAGRMCSFSRQPVVEFLARVQRELTGWDISVLFTGDKRELQAQVGRIPPDSIHAAFTLGGDGTLNRSLDTLLDLNRKGIPVGVLPGGTANDFASELGMDLSIDCVVRAVQHGRQQATDVIRVNGEPLITVGGTGIGSLLLDEVERARQGKGKILMGLMHRLSKSEMYSMLALKGVLTGKLDPAEQDSVTYRLRATSSDRAGRSHATEFITSAMFVCNQQKLGGNLTVSPSSSPSDGIFEMLALQGIGRVALLNALLDFKRDRAPTPALTLRASSMVLEEMDGKPITFFGDGEILLRESRLQLAIEPGKLKVLSLKPRTQTQPAKPGRVSPLQAAA